MPLHALQVGVMQPMTPPWVRSTGRTPCHKLACWSLIPELTSTPCYCLVSASIFAVSQRIGGVERPATSCTSCEYINSRFSGLLVWFVTPPFAEACWNYAQPTTWPAPITRKWGWDKIIPFDAVVREELRSYSVRSRRFTYVELDTTMSRFRPDQHPHVARDCLQFCYPGQIPGHTLSDGLLTQSHDRNSTQWRLYALVATLIIKI